MSEEKLKPGVRLKHYKGDQYEVITKARLESDETELLIYKSLRYPFKQWARPVNEVFQNVNWYGMTERRFTIIQNDR